MSAVLLVNHEYRNKIANEDVDGILNDETVTFFVNPLFNTESKVFNYHVFGGH